MLGIPDLSVFLAFILTVLSAAGCAVFGFLKWNSGGEVSTEEMDEARAWFAEKYEVDKELSGEMD